MVIFIFLIIIIINLFKKYIFLHFLFSNILLPTILNYNLMIKQNYFNFFQLRTLFYVNIKNIHIQIFIFFLFLILL